MALLSLLVIDPDGSPRGFHGPLPGFTRDVFNATVSLYQAGGFKEPWVGYLALEGSVPVGTCGFKSVPVERRVKIAYFTFPEFEGRGIVTSMAADVALLREKGFSVERQPAASQEEANSSTDEVELEFWRSVKDSDDSEDFEAYLNRYPNGAFAELARLRVERQKSSEPTPPTSASISGDFSSGVPAWRRISRATSWTRPPRSTTSIPRGSCCSMTTAGAKEPRAVS
jgi:hypothetical protein